MNIPNRRPARFEPKPCGICGAMFQPVGPAHQYCSEPCRKAAKAITKIGGSSELVGLLAENIIENQIKMIREFSQQFDENITILN